MHLVEVVDQMVVDQMDYQMEVHYWCLLGPYVLLHLVVDCCMVTDCWYSLVVALRMG